MLVEPGGARAASWSSSAWFDGDLAPAARSGLLGYAAYFGLVGLAVDWWTMTDRDRKARFRLVPIAQGGAAGPDPGRPVLPARRAPVRHPGGAS